MAPTDDRCPQPGDRGRRRTAFGASGVRLRAGLGGRSAGRPGGQPARRARRRARHGAGVPDPRGPSPVGPRTDGARTCLALPASARAGLNNGSNSGYNADEEASSVSDGIRTAFHGAQEARGRNLRRGGRLVLERLVRGSRRGVLGRPRRRRYVGCLAAQQVGLPGARRRRGGAAGPLERHPRPEPSGRSGTGRSSTRTGCWWTTGRCSSIADDHLWVMTNGMDRQEYFADAVEGPRRVGRLPGAPSCRTCRSRGRGRASSCARSPTPTWTRCGTSGSSPSR